jgi:hypothetical protein
MWLGRDLTTPLSNPTRTLFHFAGETPVDIGDELHEARHPESPHARRSVHFWCGLGKAKQRLPAPDKVARTKAKETTATSTNFEAANVNVCVSILLRF